MYVNWSQSKAKTSLSEVIKIYHLSPQLMCLWQMKNGHRKTLLTAHVNSLFVLQYSIVNIWYIKKPTSAVHIYLSQGAKEKWQSNSQLQSTCNHFKRTYSFKDILVFTGKDDSLKQCATVWATGVKTIIYKYFLKHKEQEYFLNRENNLLTCVYIIYHEDVFSKVIIFALFLLVR